MQTVVVVEPEEEPVTVEEAKRHARMYVDLTDDDPMIEGYIRAARRSLEKRLGRAFVTQALETTWHEGDECGVAGSPWGRSARASWRLPRAPVQSIVSVDVQPAGGDMEAVDPAAYVARVGTPGEVHSALGWLLASGSTIVVRYIAGYGDPDAVPEEAKLAIKMLVSHWYERREPIVAGATVAKVPFHIDALLDSLRWGNYPQ